jgi:hypothetical protein
MGHLIGYLSPRRINPNSRDTSFSALCDQIQRYWEAEYRYHLLTGPDKLLADLLAVQAEHGYLQVMHDGHVFHMTPSFDMLFAAIRLVTGWTMEGAEPFQMPLRDALQRGRQVEARYNGWHIIVEKRAGDGYDIHKQHVRDRGEGRFMTTTMVVDSFSLGWHLNGHNAITSDTKGIGGSPTAEHPIWSVIADI